MCRAQHPGWRSSTSHRYKSRWSASCTSGAFGEGRSVCGACGRGVARHRTQHVTQHTLCCAALGSHPLVGSFSLQRAWQLLGCRPGALSPRSPSGPARTPASLLPPPHPADPQPPRRPPWRRHPASGYVQGINDLVTPFMAVFMSEHLEGPIEGWSVGGCSDDLLLDIEADCYWWAGGGGWGGGARGRGRLLLVGSRDGDGAGLGREAPAGGPLPVEQRLVLLFLRGAEVAAGSGSGKHVAAAGSKAAAVGRACAQCAQH